MNKKGFTLIELLAVIVILAIIAIIAVPIVLNIIDDSKQNATLRSADFYLDAVELTVAQATLKNENIEEGTYNIKDGDICLNDACTEILEVEVNGEVPKAGTIAITNGNITGLKLEIEGKEIYKNSKNEMVYVKFLDEVCTYDKTSSVAEKTAGAKYECKVDPNKESYTFYVLTTPTEDDTSINLIMDQNINSDGTPAGETGTTKNGENVYNLVAWISKDDYGTLYPYDGKICQYESGCALNDKGPLTAMKFLSEATKAWTNTNEMLVDTFTDDIGTIYNMKKYNTYARMPYKSEVADLTETNEYLYENLVPAGSYGDNVRVGPHGYWTLSSSLEDSNRAWNMYMYGNIISGVVNRALVETSHIYGYGVRPVINLKI